MPKVVSVINLKGGVGKTTITVALAEFLVSEHGLKVLVIDLDPQTNATVALIGEEEWDERNRKGLTLFNLFKDQLDDTNTFDLDSSIVTRTSNLKGGLTSLHLLPSSLDFIHIQDRLINIGSISLIKPIDVLKNAVKDSLDIYDLVLIDCPPNLGLVTQNGLNISDMYMVPVIPDHLSTYGIPQIIRSVNDFCRKTKTTVMPLGIVISMYRANVKRHDATISKLKAKRLEDPDFPIVFETKIPLAAKASDAADVDTMGVNTLRQKYGSSASASFDAFNNLAKEFRQHVRI